MKRPTLAAPSSERLLEESVPPLSNFFQYPPDASEDKNYCETSTKYGRQRIIVRRAVFRLLTIRMVSDVVSSTLCLLGTTFGARII